jgi:hypothetical protein
MHLTRGFFSSDVSVNSANRVQLKVPPTIEICAPNFVASKSVAEIKSKLEENVKQSKTGARFFFFLWLSDPLCLSSSSVLHFSDYYYLVHHPVNWDDQHLFALAMGPDFSITW